MLPTCFPQLPIPTPLHIALFSALERTDCAFVACHCNWETVAFFIAPFEYPRMWTRTALFGCYMAGATRNWCRVGAFCVQHTVMRHATSLHAKPHTYCACVFICNLQPAPSAERKGCFMCYSCNTKVERIPLAPASLLVHLNNKQSALIITCIHLHHHCIRPSSLSFICVLNLVLNSSY